MSFLFQPHSGFTGRIGLIYSTRTTLLVHVSHSFVCHCFVHHNVQKLTPCVVLSSEIYMRILFAMMFVGIATSLKRLWLATFLGQRSYAHYGPDLEVILGKMLMISQVAHLARQIEENVITSHVSDGYVYTMKHSIALPLMSDSEDETNSPLQNCDKKSFDELTQDGFGESLKKQGIGSKLAASLHKPKLDHHRSERLLSAKNMMSSSTKLALILEEWEEPDIKANATSKFSITNILQFRQAVSMMDDTYPFTPGKSC